MQQDIGHSDSDSRIAHWNVRAIAAMALVSGVWLATLGAFLWRDAEHRRSLQTEATSKQAELVDLAPVVREAEDLNRQLLTLQAALNQVESRVPQRKQVDDVLAEVTELARADALQTRVVKPVALNDTNSGAAVAWAPYACQSARLSVSGDFNGFYASYCNWKNCRVCRGFRSSCWKGRRRIRATSRRR